MTTFTHSVRYVDADGAEQIANFGGDRSAAWAFMRLCESNGVRVGFPDAQRVEPARVFHAPDSGSVWLRRADGSTATLGNVGASRVAALELAASAGLVRTGNWLIEYGKVRSFTVQA